MEKLITEFFEKNGTYSLDLAHISSFNDQIIDDFIESSYFYKIIFSHAVFQDCEFYDTNLNNCLFRNCKFSNVKFPKSKIRDCVFDNCSFLNCSFNTRLKIDKTLFKSSQFSNVDFSSLFLFKCKLEDVVLTKIHFENTFIAEFKTKNVRFYGLEFNQNKPLIFYKSEKDFKKNESFNIKDPLNFRKKVLNLD